MRKNEKQCLEYNEKTEKCFPPKSNKKVIYPISIKKHLTEWFTYEWMIIEYNNYIQEEKYKRIFEKNLQDINQPNPNLKLHNRVYGRYKHHPI